MNKAFVFFTGDILNTGFSYLLGFQPDYGFMVLKGDELFILLDNRYFPQKDIVDLQAIKDKFKNPDLNIDFLLINQNLLEIFKSLLTGFQVVLEKNLLTYNFYDFIKTNFGEIEFIDSYFEKFKIRKNSYEVIKMKKSIEITDKIYLEIKDLIDRGEIYGKTEKQIQSFIIKSLLDKGAEKESFDSIVAYGQSSAIPHHQTSKQYISKGVLLIDSGVICDNYCSDFTRTYWLGTQNDDYKLFIKIYGIVKTAYFIALENSKIGVECKYIDKLVRDYFESKGYLKYFNHSLGHGIGMQAHEAPSINLKSTRIFEENMFFTIEPGIYLPKKFGIRLENVIHMTSTGPKVYSKVPI